MSQEQIHSWEIYWRKTVMNINWESGAVPVSCLHVVFINKRPDSSLSFQEVKSCFTEKKNSVKIAYVSLA